MFKKRVLILGLGINQGGLGSTKFFAEAGAKVRVTDLKTKDQLQSSLDELKNYSGIEYVLGGHRFKDLDWADLIIKNPALKPDNPYVLYALEKGKQVEMDIGVFLQFVSPDQIIGVTGTKGKSTTASLIYEALKASKKDVVFAGNIGKSVLDTVPLVKTGTLVILELSSFQLLAFEQHRVSPKWAAVTNIYPDHLNYHGSMESYVNAKRAIAKYQDRTGFLFVRHGDHITDQPVYLKNLEGKVVRSDIADLPKGFSPKLPGEHSKANIAQALAVAKIHGVREDIALKAMADFAGVEFRLQLVRESGGVKIYNDTAATTPAATIQALQTLPNSILIAGGVNKDLPYRELAKAIEKYAKAVYFLEGTATDEILKELKGSPFFHKGCPSPVQKTQYNNLEKLLTDIKAVAQPGDTILFSPGAASFNLFQNEFDRGRKFNQAIEKIFGRKNN